MKIGPVDHEIALLIVKTKKLRKVKYIARSKGLQNGRNKSTAVMSLRLTPNLRR